MVEAGIFVLGWYGIETKAKCKCKTSVVSAELRDADEQTMNAKTKV